MITSIKHASSYRRLAKTVKKKDLEYLKEKRKEEQKNFISINAVVDLMSDKCSLESRRVSCTKNIFK